MGPREGARKGGRGGEAFRIKNEAQREMDDLTDADYMFRDDGE